MVAQRATLQEQRNHIGILDTALTNAQHNIRRLEEELHKKQIHIEKLSQSGGGGGIVIGGLSSSSPGLSSVSSAVKQQNDRKMIRNNEYDAELMTAAAKESNRSGSSTNSEVKWQQEANNQRMRFGFIFSNLCRAYVFKMIFFYSEHRHMEEQAMRQNAAKLASRDKNNQVSNCAI